MKALDCALDSFDSGEGQVAVLRTDKSSRYMEYKILVSGVHKSQAPGRPGE
jgi:hypothetical protein